MDEQKEQVQERQEQKKQEQEKQALSQALQAPPVDSTERYILTIKSTTAKVQGFKQFLLNYIKDAKNKRYVTYAIASLELAEDYANMLIVSLPNRAIEEQSIEDKEYTLKEIIYLLIKLVGKVSFDFPAGYLSFHDNGLKHSLQEASFWLSRETNSGE